MSGGDAAPMVPCLPCVLACAAACACAGAEVGVDEPRRWYDLAASHHGQHALGGAALGALGYGAAALVTEERDRRVACGIALGVVVGVGYEVAMAARGGDGHSEGPADPVDAAWVAVGALAGVVVADLTGQAVELAVTPRSAAIVVAWRF
jgi:hypothetical protein